MLLHPLQRHPRPAGLALGAVAGVGVGGGEQAAEVAVAGGGLDQQGQVGEVRRAHALPDPDRQLGAGDRPYPQPLQAWANSIDPQTPSWSVRAIAG